MKRLGRPRWLVLVAFLLAASFDGLFAAAVLGVLRFEHLREPDAE
ncbi:MAG TPA: hypothetical protein VNZ44_03690 [Pyrinomonadaceae bacterium]|nr:hypothetical protein [Pyrinomonadaceae bacterium]